MPRLSNLDDVLFPVEEHPVFVSVKTDSGERRYDPLASGPDNLRWRNAAQWARHSMVKDGLLKDDSPRGVWEIADKGRTVLAEAS